MKNAYEMVLVPKNVFSTLIVGFLAENQKVEKIRKYYEETEYFEKKRFYLLKRHFYQNGKAENMLVVAGRLVLFQMA